MSVTKSNIDRGRPLAGRTAIVTGSGQNIGKSIALYFAAAGANVIVNGHRNQAAIDKVVKEIEDTGGKAMACLADASNADAVAAMVKKAEDKFGKVDIAVSNVSVRHNQPFLNITLEEWDATLKTNLSSAFYLARAVLPEMQKSRWGRLIHISGVDGFVGHIPGRAHNVVCKAGVHGLTKAIAIEFAADGITANTVSPGVINTDRDLSQRSKNWLKMRSDQIPMKKIGRVDDIATACVYLAGDSGSYITGHVIHVNGGQFMG